MIKEKAKEIYFSGVGIKSKEKRVEAVIDFMLDDFNSRTCENCKHYFNAITRDENHNNTLTPTCMKFALSDGEYTIYPAKDFGCNKFECS